MGEKEIEEVFLREWMFRSGSDAALTACIKELDSVDNLNNNPLAIRKAGFQAMRRAFVLGAQYAFAKAATDAAKFTKDPVMNMKDCPYCHTTGYRGLERCPACEGRGRVPGP